MGLILTNAILHTIGRQEEGAQFSNAELDIDSEVCSQFVSKHVRRLLNNPGARDATFTAQSAVYEIIKDYQKGNLRFREMSTRLCERLASIIRDNEDIPQADILIAAFDNAGKTYLAILKLNYGECFTHRLIETENGLENQIIKNTAVLPLSASKIEEACLIPYDPMILRVMEKPHMVSGEETEYFSKLFLECETEISKKEAADAILDIAQEINEKFYGGNVEMEAKVKCALVDEAEGLGEEDGLNLGNVAIRAFAENEEARLEFVSKAQECGLPYEVPLDEPFVKREFKTQRFKAENGIEIKCPTELFQDPDAMQIVTNPDGTVTLTLKNLRRQEPSAREAIL